MAQTPIPNPQSPIPVTNLHRAIASQSGWLNTSRPIAADDLAGRIVLLDFWTFCCINCIHVIPDLKYLEEKFGDKLTVIGVHSAKFRNERDTENIRSAILRYGIHHPVVNDFDFKIWQSFGVRAWPTFILINPRGMIEATYSGEGNRQAVERDVEKLIAAYGKQVNSEKLPMALEEAKEAPSILSFPGKIAFGILPPLAGGDVSAEALAKADKEGGGLPPLTPPAGGRGVLFVSDSGNQRIVVMSPEGAILETIGSGETGNTDGAFENAGFNAPQGVLYRNGMLYIADTGNHSLRVADLSARTVITLAGTGKQGYERKANNAPALSTPLASPWDLAFYPDAGHIAIAMAGTHQLWSYDIENKTVSVIAGSGRESIDDGRYPFNSLSQPSGLAVHDGKLYFVDSETSSLRVLEDGTITTLIGTGLFDFGYKEGKHGEALMQHALGVFADDSGIYVADSYNHSIRRYDPATGVLYNFAGHGERGRGDGALAESEFNEPNDLLKLGDTFYVADTNNHALRIIEGGKVSTLAVSEQTSAPEYSDTLPNLEEIPATNVSSHAPVAVTLGLQKGWHINEEAPSTLALFNADKKPLASFSLAEIRAERLTLPALKEGAHVRLQGTLYYCEEKEGAQCLVKSYNAELTAKPDGKKEITLTLN